MKIELFRSTNNRQWYFRIRAKNGRILAQSEGYRRKASAIHAVAALLVGIPNAKVVHRT